MECAIHSPFRLCILLDIQGYQSHLYDTSDSGGPHRLETGSSHHPKNSRQYGFELHPAFAPYLHILLARAADIASNRG